MKTIAELGVMISKRAGNSKSQRRFGLSAEGFTLIELMISITILALITPAMLLLLSKTRQAFAAEEMHMQLRSINEQSVNRIHLSLGSNRHIYEGGAGVSFVALVQPAAGTPPVLGGSQLPIDMQTSSGSLSPNSPGFVPGNIGNSLFFLAYDAPQTYVPGGGKPVSISYAPITLTEANQNAVSQTVIVDAYRFFYYYLTSTDPESAPALPAYSLVEWQSIQYADYAEVSGISDGTLMGNVSQGLLNLGIKDLVDPTATAPASLFYDLQTGGVYPKPNLTLKIAQYRYSYLTKTSYGRGILSSGFLYGISPNSSLWTQQTAAPAKVPEYATASITFPGGFEVGLSGTTAGREIMLRSVLVAKGAAPKVEVDDMNTVVETRDE